MAAAKICDMATARTRDTRLDHLLAHRADERRRLVVPQVAAAIDALRLAGTEVSLVGSLARGDFRVNSDVDLLVMNRGILTETQIFNVICDHLKASAFDLAFADQMAPESVELMRTNARVRA